MSPALASILFCLLSLTASALCNSALFVVDPISRFDPSCGVEADCGAADWLTDRQTQSTSASWHRCLCCAHPPFCKNEPITLRLLVPNPDPLLCLCSSRHKHATPSCSATAPFTIWSEDRTAGSSFVSLTGCNGMHYTTTSQIPLFITYGQEQTWDTHHVSKAEATLWRAIVEEETGDLAWQLIHLSECIMTWSTSTKCIWKSEMIVQFHKIEYCNTSLVLQIPVVVCLAESKLLLLRLMMTYKCLTQLHYIVQSGQRGLRNQDTMVL